MATATSVYTGFWINWSGNSITGATLTIKNGAYLVAFLAMVVRTAGKHFWQLLCYILFHLLPERDTDTATPHRQQLAVLRNSNAAPDGMISFIRIALRSRASSRSLLTTPLTLALLAAINVIAFVAAAIFSSAVTGTQSMVVLRGYSCGQVGTVKSLTGTTWNQNTFVQSMTLNSLTHQNMVTASQRAFSCSNDGLLAGDCEQGSIPFYTYNTSCPFGSDVCLDRNIGFGLDTGFVDSYSAVGINTVEKDRVFFRKMLECAPLKTQGYTKKVVGFETTLSDAVLSNAFVNQSDATSANTSFMGYFYGPNTHLHQNYTFAFNPNSFQVSLGTAVGNQPYQIAVEAAAYNSTHEYVPIGSSFIPIQGLRPSNGLVSLIFLMKEALYTLPVEDPWFQAAKKTSKNITNVLNAQTEVQLYVAEDPVSVLACTENTLLSNSSQADHVTHLDLVSHLKIHSQSFGLHWNPKQISIVQRLMDNLAYSALPQAALSLNGNGLLASSKVQYGLSPGLPSNQWQVEITNWFSASLNALQDFTVQYVSGYGRDDYNSLIAPATSTEKWMCEQQIVRRDDYASFSTLGIAIILLASGCIMLLNVSVKRIVSYVRRRRTHHQARIGDEWDSYDILNLQRTTSSTGVELLPINSPGTEINTSSQNGEPARRLFPRLSDRMRRKNRQDHEVILPKQSCSLDEKAATITSIETCTTPMTDSPDSYKTLEDWK